MLPLSHRLVDLIQPRFTLFHLSTKRKAILRNPPLPLKLKTPSSQISRPLLLLGTKFAIQELENYVILFAVNKSRTNPLCLVTLRNKSARIARVVPTFREEFALRARRRMSHLSFYPFYIYEFNTAPKFSEF